MSYICETCGEPFEEDYRKDPEQKRKHPPRFCSRKCSNTPGAKAKRTWSKEKKEAQSLAVKESPYHKNRYRRPIRTCVICGEEFTAKREDQKFCSIECFKQDTKGEFRKKPPGGYREGSGRAKTGYYKGIYCGSTYELAWAIYQLDHNIPFERFPYTLYKDDKVYVPDFFQDGKIIEIKGYHSDNVEKQKEVARANGFEMIIKYKDDLKKEFEWCAKNYTYKYLQDLYDSR